MKKKYILLFIILCMALFAACNSTVVPSAETATPQGELQIEQTVFTEEQYINMITGKESYPYVNKDIVLADYIIRPKLADENSNAFIHLSAYGYEYCFTPSDDKHAYEMVVFISDSVYDENTQLMDAMKEKNSKLNEEEFEYIINDGFECYMAVKNIGNTDKIATFISFMYENHLVSVMVMADVSENYMEYCGLEKVYLGE